MPELTGRGLPEAAMSSAWWTDPDGWHAWPASRACKTAGWRLESMRADARLVRLERIEGKAAGDLRDADRATCSLVPGFGTRVWKAL